MQSTHPKYAAIMAAGKNAKLLNVSRRVDSADADVDTA